MATSEPSPQARGVTKLCIFVGTTVGSYAFWALGDSFFGFEFFGSFLLSGIGSVLGVYGGWKVAQKLAG